MPRMHLDRSFRILALNAKSELCLARCGMTLNCSMYLSRPTVELQLKA